MQDMSTYFQSSRIKLQTRIGKPDVRETYGSRGATRAKKLRGSKVWVPTPGRARPKAELGVGCGRGALPPVVRVRGIIPGKFLENSDAKSGLPRT